VNLFCRYQQPSEAEPPVVCGPDPKQMIFAVEKYKDHLKEKKRSKADEYELVFESKDEAHRFLQNRAATEIQNIEHDLRKAKRRYADIVRDFPLSLGGAK